MTLALVSSNRAAEERAKQQRGLADLLANLPGESVIELTVAFVAGTLGDLAEAREACTQLDAYRARVREIESRRRDVVIVTRHGEEDVVFNMEARDG